jgi:hypothetical protein
VFLFITFGISFAYFSKTLQATQFLLPAQNLHTAAHITQEAKTGGWNLLSSIIFEGAEHN